MSDPTQDPAEQSNAEETTTPAPWGEDFNPERAWQTITHLRGFEPTAKQFEKLSKDPDALVEFIREHHPDMLHEEPEEEPEPEYEPAYEGEDPRIQQLAQQTQAFQQWQQQVEADRAIQRFNSDLDAARGDRDVNQIGREWIFAKTIELGDNKAALQKATEQWFEFEDSLVSKAPTKRPRAPHVPSGGQTATGTKRPEDMTSQELLAWQVQKYAELTQQ